MQQLSLLTEEQKGLSTPQSLFAPVCNQIYTTFPYVLCGLVPPNNTYCTAITELVLIAMLQKHRGAALGFYNWGIYLGYSIAFSFDFVLKTDSLGWRWVYTIASLPGFVMAIVMLLTVREPARQDVNQV